MWPNSSAERSRIRDQIMSSQSIMSRHRMRSSAKQDGSGTSAPASLKRITGEHAPW